MANTVQLFQSMRDFYKMIGIHPLQLNHGAYNLRNSIVLLFMTSSMVSSGAFFVYKSDNIQDYSASFYAFITELIHVGFFPPFRNNMTNMFVLMDEFEAFIEKSNVKFEIFEI